jgi:hypothetical protein
VKEDLLESKIMLAVAALVIALALWAGLRLVPHPDVCRPLTPPESLYMPHGSTTCDLPVGRLSPADQE